MKMTDFFSVLNENEGICLHKVFTNGVQWMHADYLSSIQEENDEREKKMHLIVMCIFLLFNSEHRFVYMLRSSHFLFCYWKKEKKNRFIKPKRYTAVRDFDVNKVKMSEFVGLQLNWLSCRQTLIWLWLSTVDFSPFWQMLMQIFPMFELSILIY